MSEWVAASEDRTRFVRERKMRVSITLILLSVGIHGCNKPADIEKRADVALDNRVADDADRKKMAVGAWARGNTFRDKKEYDKAIAEQTEAIRLFPKFADAYFERAYSWMEKKEFESL
jgi:tetratricopeptide (TPR) repeat protein